jgi:dTMP kinase
MSAPGRLLSVEGIDGVGKTTHAGLIVLLLRQAGIPAISFREPGATPLGEQLRVILKQSDERTALSELLLFAAARAELVATLLKPALAAGTWVVLDRFTDSTLAYQGALGGIAEDDLACVCRIAAAGLKPDLTLWLDLNPETALQRNYPLADALNTITSAAEALDAIERRDAGYFKRVHERYQRLHQSQPERIVRIDASGTVETTAAQIAHEVGLRIKEWWHG